MKTLLFSIEKKGKICGQTTDFETAKRFARNLGNNTYIFCNGIVVYSL